MKRFLSICILLTSVCLMDAKVSLAPIFADHMVLQQQTDAAIWGHATPKAKVSISTTWSESVTVVKADADGRWFARVATPVAGGPYEISFNDGEELVLKNILIGEVWICLGQSNMTMPMKGFTGQPVEGAAELIMGAKPSVQIRSCKVKSTKSLTVQDECPATWYEHTPTGVSKASAVAYFFAKNLHETLEVPVGVITAAWGGAMIEAWIKEEVLRKDFADEFSFSHLESQVWPPEEKGNWRKENKNLCSVLYNGMLHSIVPFTAKGFIFYHGCSNVYRHEQYKRLQPAFVKMLREEWGNDKMPFYFTQIAPYQHEGKDRPEAAYMMWAQAQTLEMIPYSGMATTHDVGDLAAIHPPKKKQVGDRLAYLALENDYGLDYIDAKAPFPINFEFKEGQVIVTFDTGKMGVSPIHTDLSGFELAGEDKVFYPAVGRVLGAPRTSIMVYNCPEVPHPVAVRYGMRNYSEASLFNNFGIPVTPFRSDDWE